MGRGVIGQCLETSVAVCKAEHVGDGQPSASQLSVEIVFYNLSVCFAADKYGIALRHIADALFVAVGLVAGYKRVGLHFLDVTSSYVCLYVHQIESCCCRFVVDDGKAVAA